MPRHGDPIVNTTGTEYVIHGERFGLTAQDLSLLPPDFPIRLLASLNTNPPIITPYRNLFSYILRQGYEEPGSRSQPPGLLSDDLRTLVLANQLRMTRLASLAMRKLRDQRYRQDPDDLAEILKIAIVENGGRYGLRAWVEDYFAEHPEAVGAANVGLSTRQTPPEDWREVWDVLTFAADRPRDDGRSRTSTPRCRS